MFDWVKELVKKFRKIRDSIFGEKEPEKPKYPVDAIDWNSIAWCGTHGSKAGAQVNKVLRGVSVRGNMTSWDYDTISDWPSMGHSSITGKSKTKLLGKLKKIKGRKQAKWESYARCCVFTDIGGRMKGGHYDWFVKDAKRKDLTNVYDGYLYGSETPERGGQLYFCMVSNDGKYRTNVVKGT